MFHDQMTPNTAAGGMVEVPPKWPACPDIARRAGEFTLVMALHPQCPCSRASVSELGQLMARTAGKMDAVALFVVPAGAPADWLRTDLLNQVKQIPGVRIIYDRDGADARRFGADTSGQVALFDPAGTLVFCGGITDGRGHEGDNVGSDAVLDLVRGQRGPVVRTDVYGCSLGLCPVSQQGEKQR